MGEDIQYCTLCGKRLDIYEGHASHNTLLSFRIQYLDGKLQDNAAPFRSASSHLLEAYNPYAAMICAAAYRLTGDKRATERLVCETFATVLRQALCEGTHASPKRHLLSTLRSTFLEGGFAKA